MRKNAKAVKKVGQSKYNFGWKEEKHMRKKKLTILPQIEVFIKIVICRRFTFSEKGRFLLLLSNTIRIF